MKRLAGGILAAWWLASCQLLTAATYYVATNGSDATGDGTSANPWLTISNGVRLASAVPGNVVLVSNGVYAISTQINLAARITVQGWSANRADTVVDGVYTTRCFYINHSNALLSGLTVTRGTNSGDGGGIYVDSAGGTVSNCVVTACIAQHGGGVRLNGNGLLTHSAILGNNAFRVGGGFSGAGVYLRFSSNTVANCVIASNDSSLGTIGGGAGILVGEGRNSLVRDSVIYANTAEGYGGGMLIYKANTYLITRCVISNNYNTGSGDFGGGVSFGVWGGSYSTGMFENCVIADNKAANAGGLYCYGGVNVLRNCLIKSNSITNNASCYGGGLFIAGGTRVENCTVVGNKNTYAGHGGGIWTAPNVILNTVAWSNEGGDIAVSSGTLALTNCCAPNADTFAGPGNITNHPAFFNSGANDWRLSGSSPCFNRGANQEWTTNAVDLDARTRLRYQTVDMGAYEYIHDAMIFSAW